MNSDPAELGTPARPYPRDWFEPWPLAPGARLGWRTGGRFCALVGDPSDERLSQGWPPSMDRWHIRPGGEPVHTDAGPLRVGKVCANANITPYAAIGRATPSPDGVWVAGVLVGEHAGAEQMYRAGSVAAAFFDDHDKGWELCYVSFMLGAGAVAPAAVHANEFTDEEWYRIRTELPPVYTLDQHPGMDVGRWRRGQR